MIVNPPETASVAAGARPPSEQRQARRAPENQRNDADASARRHGTRDDDRRHEQRHDDIDKGRTAFQHLATTVMAAGRAHVLHAE